MSTLPCDGHGSVARGRLLGLYPALVQDGTRLSSYRRLCQQCMAELIATHRRDWIPGFMHEDPTAKPTCTSCGVLVDNVGLLAPFFCTAYVKPDQRVDYQAKYCKDCSEIVIHEFHLAEKTNGKQ